MNKNSTVEYNNLRSDLKEIKSCITRYIGYIIGISGLTAVIAKYLIASETGSGLAPRPFSAIVIVTSIFMVTFLFEILWYKFKSHNRYSGYMQLLSQETDLFMLDESMKNDPEKTYLTSKELEIYDDSEDFIIWELIMSRTNNTKEKSSLKQILKATERAYYNFGYNQDYDADKLSNYTSYDTKFYNKIIYPINKRKTGIRNFCLFVLNAIIQTVSIFFNRFPQLGLQRIDNKYISYGWNYPIKIIQIGFISITGLSLSLFFIISQNSHEFNKYYVYDERINLGVILYFATFLILARWIFNFIGKSHEILFGRYSIDYYSWLFFIFRIQYLNSKNILPKYYSRSYVRFFRSRMILNYLEINPYEQYYGEKKIFDYQKYIQHLRNCSKLPKSYLKKHKRFNTLAKEYFKAIAGS